MLGKVSIIVDAAMANFESDMGRAARVAEKEFGKMERDARQAQRKMEATAKKIGTALGAAFSAAAIGAVAFSRQMATTARDVERFALLSNTSENTFQRWAAGAKTVGIEQDKLADILKDMSDRVGDFIQTGGGPMADFFENIAPKVGVTAEQFARLSGPEALQLFVSSLEKAGVSANDMTFYMEAIASDSTLLLPLLQANGRAMEELGDNAERTGAIMSDDLIASAKEAHREMMEFETALAGVRNELAAELLPRMTEVANSLTEFNSQGSMAEGIAQALGRGFDVVAGMAQGVVAGIRQITITIAEMMNQASSWYEIVSNVATFGLAPGTVKGGWGQSARGWQNYMQGSADNGAALMGGVDRIWNGRQQQTDPYAGLSTEPSMAPAEWRMSLPGNGPTAADRKAAEAAAKAAETAGKAAAKAAERVAKEAQRAAEEAAEEADRIAQDSADAFDEAMMRREEATAAWTTRIDDLAAQLSGPAAEALLTFKRQMADADAAMRTGAISAEQHAAYVADLGEAYGDALDEIEKASDEMSVYAEQAARNMQDAFADFLFDPFDGGVKGMLESFGNTLRKMIAQAAAAQIFQQIGQWGQANAGAGGWMGAFAGILSNFGGGRAIGGPVSAGGMYEVLEGGRSELLRQKDGRTYLMPGSDGTVIPAGSVASGGAMASAPVFNINVQNAPNGADVNTRRNGSGGMDIDVILKQVDQYIGSNIASGTGATYAAQRGRFGLRDAV